MKCDNDIYDIKTGKVKELLQEVVNGRKKLKDVMEETGLSDDLLRKLCRDFYGCSIRDLRRLNRCEK